MTASSRVPLLLTLCLPALWACSADLDDDDALTAADGSSGGTGASSGNGDGDGDPAEGEGGDGDGDGGDPGEGDSGGGDGGDSGTGDTGGIEPGQLTAGEWRDLDNWTFWIDLGIDGSPWAVEFDRWGFDTRARVPVLALSEGVPVADTPVVLRDSDQQVLWRARTDNHGEAELWPSLFGVEPSWPLTIEIGDESIELQVLGSPLDPVIFELPAPTVVSDLDLMFVIDTTGSMSDELEYLKVELEDVIQRVEAEVGGDFNLRLSVNFYRDVGDEYVVRSFPFTTDISLALTQLAAQVTNGGGDYEEAVEQGLLDGVDGHTWSTSARARMLFLILDAPPHDTSPIRASLAESVASAAEKGIRVIPVGASGINKETEFLLRNIDIATGSTYTFLTGHSGIGGEHLEPTTGEYAVELFNDLLVRLTVEAME